LSRRRIKAQGYSRRRRREGDPLWIRVSKEVKKEGMSNQGHGERRTSRRRKEDDGGREVLKK
jgi:hypothetical protein